MADNVVPGATALVKPASASDGVPSRLAVCVAFPLIAGSILAALLLKTGDGFTPRVDTIDALAGLAIGAFIVDRLLTFVPPIVAAPDAEQRAVDLTTLRIAYGTVIGAVFVILTNLQAVEALGGGTTAIGEGTDRAIAVMAIAGGVAGLARLWSGINPQLKTDATTAEAADEKLLAPPSPAARTVGLALVAGGALVALTALHDKSGVELLGPDTPSADGTVAVVVRFGVVLVAAAIVQQLAELAGRLNIVDKVNKPVILGGIAVVLGVVAARIFDLYLLHNIGFFDVTKDMGMDKALAASTSGERWGDAFLTGVVIAAGTKPLHDIAARLRKTAAT